MNSKEALELLETPTALLLQHEKEAKFGFEAEKTFKELTENGSNKECNFFNKFITCLHQHMVRLLSVCTSFQTFSRLTIVVKILV